MSHQGIQSLLSFPNMLPKPTEQGTTICSMHPFELTITSHTYPKRLPSHILITSFLNRLCMLLTKSPRNQYMPQLEEKNLFWQVLQKVLPAQPVKIQVIPLLRTGYSPCQVKSVLSVRENMQLHRAALFL